MVQGKCKLGGASKSRVISHLHLQGWKTKSVGAYLATLALLFLLALAQEAIHSSRRGLLATSAKASLLYASNLLTSYLLMLAVMTLNVGVLLVIIAGLCVGRYIMAILTAERARTASAFLADQALMEELVEGSDTCCVSPSVEDPLIIPPR